MILRIKSKNKDLLSLLNKNPNTDSGLYMKPHKNGHIVGNVISEHEYHCFFQDTKGSFAHKDASSIDKGSLCSPVVCLDIVSQFFGHLLKTDAQQKEISWLKATHQELDNKECTVEIDSILINSNWNRDGEFMLCRYIDGLSVVEKYHDIYNLSFTADNVFKAINTLMIVCFMIAVSNREGFYIEKERLNKYVNIFQNTHKIPYFVYYLFIKRCLGKSINEFDKHIPTLEAKYTSDHNQTVSFTPNDTHKDRMDFVRDNLNYEQEVINFGCGEFRHERFWGKRLGEKRTLISYDVEDYSELHKKYLERLGCEWVFTQNLRPHLSSNKTYQIVCSEVVEHDLNVLNEIKQLIKDFNISKVIITTPNVSFNKHYNLEEGELRRDDHVLEWTYEQFQTATLDFGGEYHKIGDCVEDDCVTSGLIVDLSNTK